MAAYRADVQYGYKQTVTALLQEWVADVGSRAGLTQANTRLSSGSVGVAESRLELEVTFPTLTDWEHFLSAIPTKEHRAWSQRVQAMIVGGSPRWELFRAVSAFPDGYQPPAGAGAAAQGAAAQGAARAPTAAGTAAASTASELPLLSSSNGSNSSHVAGSSIWLGMTGSGSGSSSTGSGSSTMSGSSGTTTTTTTSSGLSIVDGKEDAEVVLDWKGEPLKINPGDKLPFKFL
ncbi:hypothetical protein Agub_g2182 [Astrephomene gubernaculifera]|uniref:Uncharacterized protein n=1 Tax=Astrephomene gubernaculifera TaxID=47775 RepID=A0AAD3DKE7_9CHLO|nr:hypothetical protein Agub_g2182 [Astrephomene gubernaculifera]